jgi:hypothetical protein
MMNGNKDEQKQHRMWSSASLPTGRQNKYFGAAVKYDLTTRSCQKLQVWDCCI